MSMQDHKPEKPLHTAHGEAQQQALVLAAFDLIAEGGFERLRTRDVAQRAGVNIATLHYYFATKEDLIRGVVTHLVAEFSLPSPLLTPMASDGPREQLQQDFADVRYQVQTTPATYLVLFELFLRSFRDPAIRAIMQEMDLGWRHHIESYVRMGMQQGVFRTDLEPATMAAALVALIKGCVMEILITSENFPVEEIFTAVERWLAEHAT